MEAANHHITNVSNSHQNTCGVPLGKHNLANSEPIEWIWFRTVILFGDIMYYPPPCQVPIRLIWQANGNKSKYQPPDVLQTTTRLPAKSYLSHATFQLLRFKFLFQRFEPFKQVNVFLVKSNTLTNY